MHMLLYFSHLPDLCGTFFKVQRYRNVNSSIKNLLGTVVLLLNANERYMNTGNSTSSKAEKYLYYNRPIKIILGPPENVLR